MNEFLKLQSILDGLERVRSEEDTASDGSRDQAKRLYLIQMSLLELDDTWPDVAIEDPPHQKAWEEWARLASRWAVINRLKHEQEMESL